MARDGHGAAEAVPEMDHALADLGDCRGAVVAWEESLRQGAVQRTQEMEQLVARRRACAASFPQAAPAPPEPRDPSAREQRDRAEAELAAAAAAARRADQIEGLRAARQRNVELNRQWEHAESLLAVGRESASADCSPRSLSGLQAVESGRHPDGAALLGTQHLGADFHACLGARGAIPVTRTGVTDGGQEV